MPVLWNNVRIPQKLHDRIVALTGAFDHAAWMGWTNKVPSEFADRGGTPIWYVVERAIADFEAHRQRSRRRRASRMRSAANHQLSSEITKKLLK
jgi:hypothetical protein